MQQAGRTAGLKQQQAPKAVAQPASSTGLVYPPHPPGLSTRRGQWTAAHRPPRPGTHRLASTRGAHQRGQHLQSGRDDRGSLCERCQLSGRSGKEYMHSRGQGHTRWAPAPPGRGPLTPGLKLPVMPLSSSSWPAWGPSPPPPPSGRAMSCGQNGRPRAVGLSLGRRLAAGMQQHCRQALHSGPTCSWQDYALSASCPGAPPAHAVPHLMGAPWGRAQSSGRHGRS